MTARWFALLLLLLAPLDLGLAAAVYRYFGPPWDFQTEIRSFEVVEQGDDFVVLEFDYSYTGEPGGHTFIGAITLVNGRSEGQWSYRPAPLAVGHHRARVRIGKNASHPEPYCSTEIEVSMYRPRTSGFYMTIFPFETCWG